MNRRTLDAITACTRTLGESPDADTGVLESGAVTVGSLRAVADRAALRSRFHRISAHEQHRPRDPRASALYESLATARLDALGVHWLAGVARNITEYPGAREDGLRWLAFECFAGLPAPQETKAHKTSVQNRLAATDAAALAALREYLDDPTRFAAHAASWCQTAAGSAPDLEERGAAHRFAIPDAPGGVDVRRGRYALPGKSRVPEQTNEETSASDAAGARAEPDPVIGLGGYRAYTTAFDRVVNATSLASREELERLRLSLDADFSQVRSLVSRVAKRLLRVLMARQTREWRFDQDDGFLDPSRLPTFIASGGAARPFKQEFESPFPSTVVSLLIDHSGSMAGRPMKTAALTVEIFVRVLERCGVACEVLGFTTREWDGGEPARKWAADGYPEQPGRLNALEHIIIKSASTPWRRARPALGLFMRDELLKENIDGEALAWAHRRMLARSEQRRILVVVSDGTPTDEATFAANGFDYLDSHLASVVHYIESRSPVTLAAIGIGHDVSQFYRNATRISSIDELGPALTTRLVELLTAD